MAARNQLDRVGNHCAVDKRFFPALCAHKSAGGPGFGVVFDRRPPRGADASLPPPRQPPQMKVARHDFDPGIGDTNDRARKILIGKSDGFQHCACRSTGWADQQIVTFELGFFRHVPYFFFFPSCFSSFFASVSITVPAAASMCTSVTFPSAPTTSTSQTVFPCFFSSSASTTVPGTFS